jgi:hypothetical protein
MRWKHAKGLRKEKSTLLLKLPISHNQAIYKIWLKREEILTLSPLNKILFRDLQIHQVVATQIICLSPLVFLPLRIPPKVRKWSETEALTIRVVLGTHLLTHSFEHILLSKATSAPYFIILPVYRISRLWGKKIT